jgi:hypothetical protein
MECEEDVRKCNMKHLMKQLMNMAVPLTVQDSLE